MANKFFDKLTGKAAAREAAQTQAYADAFEVVGMTNVNKFYGKEFVDKFNHYLSNDSDHPVFNDSCIGFNKDNLYFVDTDRLVNNYNVSHPDTPLENDGDDVHYTMEKFVDIVDAGYKADGYPANDGSLETKHDEHFAKSNLASAILAPKEIVGRNIKSTKANHPGEKVSSEALAKTLGVNTTDVMMTRDSYASNPKYDDKKLLNLRLDNIANNNYYDVAQRQVDSDVEHVNENADVHPHTMAGKEVGLMVNKLFPVEFKDKKTGQSRDAYFLDVSKRGDIPSQSNVYDGKHVVNHKMKDGTISHVQVISEESAQRILEVNGYDNVAEKDVDHIASKGNLVFDANVFLSDMEHPNDFKINPNPDLIKESNIEFNGATHDMVANANHIDLSSEKHVKSTQVDLER